MAKRRTRKQKQKAKHQHLLSWDPTEPNTVSEAKVQTSEPVVKGQFKSGSGSIKSKSKTSKNAPNMAKDYNLASIKRDITKSVFLASLILSLQVVIYFIL